MTERQRTALRQLRGTDSLLTFIGHLRDHGFTATLSRQRLSQVEQGDADLPDALWDAIADALIRAGRDPGQVGGLWPSGTPVRPPPPSTPALRVRQWTRIVDRLIGNRWWYQPNSLMERFVGIDRAHAYQRLAQHHGIDLERQRAETRRRLAAGAESGPFEPDPADAVLVDARSELHVAVQPVELFVLRAVLHNAGTVPWRDRLLYRLGPPVTSSLPFTPGVLPVPDAEPGETCDIAIPGRAQWFPNLATVSYVLVHADCSPSAPGRLPCQVDTRRPGRYDHTLPMPPEELA